MHRTASTLGWALATAFAAGCHRKPEHARASVPTATQTDASTVELTQAELPASAPVRTEDVAVPGDLSAVVVRGGRADGVRMVFLSGMCTHPGGYVMAFEHAAAAHGELVAVQGDLPCGSDATMRRWSSDLGELDRRIDAAFAAAGFGAPEDVLVIGYSQGAERAEHLVGRFPDKYTRAILMASPIRPSAARLGRARAVVTMAGTYDMSKPRMRDAVSMLERAGVSADFVEIPEAHHGGMGTEPELMMDRALDFVAAERGERGR